MTAPDAADIGGDPVDLGAAAREPTPGAPRSRATRKRKGQLEGGADLAPTAPDRTPAEAEGADLGEQMADVVPAVTPVQPTRPRRRPVATPRRRAAPDPAAALARRRASLNQGLEAIIEFVDGPARRAAATACADALLLAVPKAQRGPDLEAFLHAAGARRPPSRLQEMAEDAGIEVATAIKQVNASIRELTPG